jgi:hypothetical protein
MSDGDHQGLAKTDSGLPDYDRVAAVDGPAHEETLSANALVAKEALGADAGGGVDADAGGVADGDAGGSAGSSDTANSDTANSDAGQARAAADLASDPGHSSKVPGSQAKAAPSHDLLFTCAVALAPVAVLLLDFWVFIYGRTSNNPAIIFNYFSAFILLAIPALSCLVALFMFWAYSARIPMRALSPFRYRAEQAYSVKIGVCVAFFFIGLFIFFLARFVSLATRSNDQTLGGILITCGLLLLIFGIATLSCFSLYRLFYGRIVKPGKTSYRAVAGWTAASCAAYALGCFVSWKYFSLLFLY